MTNVDVSENSYIGASGSSFRLPFNFLDYGIFTHKEVVEIYGE